MTNSVELRVLTSTAEIDVDHLPPGRENPYEESNRSYRNAVSFQEELLVIARNNKLRAKHSEERKLPSYERGKMGGRSSFYMLGIEPATLVSLLTVSGIVGSFALFLKAANPIIVQYMKNQKSSIKISFKYKGKKIEVENEKDMKKAIKAIDELEE